MAERLDTADDYGRSEGCFIDHRSPPFCFEDYVAGLQETKEPVDANGLISVSDLQPGILPNPTIRIDDLDQTDTEESILLELQSDPMSQQRSNYLRNVSDLLHRCYVPLEVVQLDSDPDIDVADYLSIVSDRSNPDLVKQWLPFCPIRHDKGEGLDYPPHSNRFRCLLLRELEIERITVPEAALNICQLIETDLKAEFDVKLPRNGNIEGPVSRPLSPISESGSPFIPDGTVAIIDLISEPSSSPKSVHLATQTVARHSRDLSNSNMVKNFKGTKMTSVTVNDRNKSELPVFSTTGLPNLTSGDLKALPLAHKQLDQALGNIDNSGAGHEGGQFDEVISEIVEPTHHHSPPMVEQEHHSGLRTLTRLPVPSMPFHVAPAPWTTHVSSARIQFDWIIGNQLQSTRSLDVTGEEQEAHLSLELDVDVSAIDTYRRLLDEDAIFSQQNVSLNFDADLESTFESRNESSLTLPFILQLADEPDVGEPPSSPDIAKSMTISPQLKPKYEESPFFGSKKAATCAQTRDKSEALDALPLLSNGNAIGDLLPRRDSENNPLGALPLSNDDETTAKLLLSYMELRAVKTRRLDKGAPRTKQVTSSVTMEPPQQRPENNSPKVEEAAISAYSPKLQIPIIMGVFIISHNLPRPILRHLESVWPPDHILDRDYTAHNNVTTPAAAGLLESKTLSAYEADISLTPVVGVVITNLIKVGQKPLPGSKALPELRERIARVSLKYETLVILVSECNPLGEYCGHSNAAEMTAFDDFVRFTSELQQGIAVHFLHGAFKTAANWALDLMCRNSSIAASFKSYLSNMESAWELHLRRAGLNAFAAQVLAGVLFEEMGDAGLARFAAMSAQERVSRFSQLLGGSKGLLHVRPVCDL